MTLRSLVILGVVTACAVATAIASSTSWDTADAVSKRGDAFAPAIVRAAQEIGEITIVNTHGTAIFTRRGGDFLDASGYPSKLDTIRDLIKSLSALTIEENKTTDPARHHELELAPPGAQSGGGTLIALKSSDGGLIESIVIGKADYTVGGGGGGHFVRKEKDNQTYLVRGSVKLPFDRAGWFDTALFDIGNGSVARATLFDGSVERIAFERKDDKLTIADTPAGREANTDKIGRIGRNFGPLRFEDVRSATEKGASAEPRLVVETDGGLRIDIRSVEALADDARWVKLSATAAKPAAEDQAKSLSKTVDGFEFRLPALTGEILGWTLDDITSADSG